jgi:hypothetical protein
MVMAADKTITYFLGGDMCGWIKLHRCLMEKAIWRCSSPEHKSILITLLMMANHEDKQWVWNGKKYLCRPGQFITSLSSIALNSGTSIQNVRTALKNFQEKYDFLTNESTKQNRLITITNWDTYQNKQDSPNKEANSQLTNDQQTPNNQLTTNKNIRIKECKNKRINNYMSDSDEIRLSELLFSLILKNNPKAKRPNIQSWAKNIDLLITKDQRTPEEIEKIIRWSQADSFWCGNILSTKSLRDQFDKLYVQSNTRKGNNNEPKPPDYSNTYGFVT